MTSRVIDAMTWRSDDRDMTTDTSTTIDPDTARAAVAGFLELWNATDPAERRRAIERTYADDGCFSDPTAQVVGHDAIEEHAVGTMAIFEGRTFALVGEPDPHHDRVLFRWQMLAPDGTVELNGLDVAHLAADGRFADTTGFFLPLD